MTDQTKIKARAKPKFTRSESLIVTAKLKAAILSLFNNSDDGMTKADLKDELKDIISELYVSTDAFNYALGSLVTSGQIGRADFADSPTLYLHGSGQPPKVSKEPKVKPSIKKVEQAQKIPESLQAVKIDIVKETGKIRITIQGLTLEIGVI